MTWTACARCRTTCRTARCCARYIGRPLTKVPDPFGTHESFGHHNNARLRGFLDRFGFEYEFASSSEYLRGGGATMRRCGGCWRRMTRVLAVMLPSLGPGERRATYSPILPIHPRTGVVEQVRIDRVDAKAATVFWTDAAGASGSRPACWAARRSASGRRTGRCGGSRWGVDYEMSGKDLIDSVKLSGAICRVLGARPPIGYTYELFLDGNGQKISKSRGNGLSVRSGCAMPRRRALASSCSTSRIGPRSCSST